MVSLADAHAPGLLVEADVARQAAGCRAGRRPAIAGVRRPPAVAGHGTTPEPGAGPVHRLASPLQPAAKPKRFHGTVTLDPTRVGRDASRIADEVIAHLAGLVGAKVTVTLEIEAEIPDRRAGPRRAHRDREQPDAEVHEPGVREGVGVPSCRFLGENRSFLDLLSSQRRGIETNWGYFLGVP